MGKKLNKTEKELIKIIQEMINAQMTEHEKLYDGDLGEIDNRIKYEKHVSRISVMVAIRSYIKSKDISEIKIYLN